MKSREILESKSSKEAAGYQPNPNNGQKCINCTMWRDPNKCSAVAGIIDPNGWCDWYAGGAYGKHGKQVSEDSRIIKNVQMPAKIKTQTVKEEPRYTAREWAIMEGGHSIEDASAESNLDIDLLILEAEFQLFAEGRAINRLRREKETTEDRHPNDPPYGPETKPTMPKGTLKVDVSDTYDWYKIGQNLGDLSQLSKDDVGKGPPDTILSFGSEEEEHLYIQALKKLGLDVTDIDPAAHGPKKGIKTDPTYNVESIKDDIEEGWKDWVAGAALSAAALSANAGGIAYQPVEKGDTVYSIARQNGVSPQEIMKLNNFNKDTKLKLGQEVKVPDNAKEEPTAKQADKKSEVKKSEPKSAPVTSNAHEKLLIKTATAAGINGTELAAFLSQVAHESHDFQSMVEYGGSLDFRKYDPKYAPKKAKALGNTKPGDGAKYKGRGYIQITGKYNYAKASAALGIDLVGNPSLAEKPAIAAKIAVWFWKLRVQPKVDNFNDVNAVTKPINPGMRGLEDRKENFKDYKMIVANL
jgi:predicted chitinase